jgi:hypothetical protein
VIRWGAVVPVAQGDLLVVSEIAGHADLVLICGGGLITGPALLGGNGLLAVNAAGALLTSIAMAATVPLTLTGTGVLTTDLLLAGSADLTLVGMATLATTTELGGSALLMLVGTGDMSPLAGTALLTLVGDGTLENEIALIGTADLTSDSIFATLQTAIEFAGAGTLELRSQGSMILTVPTGGITFMLRPRPMSAPVMIHPPEFCARHVPNEALQSVEECPALRKSPLSVPRKSAQT